MSEDAADPPAGEQDSEMEVPDSPEVQVGSLDTEESLLEGVEVGVHREAEANPAEGSGFEEHNHILVELIDANTEKPLPRFKVYWLDTTQDSYLDSGSALRKVLDQGDFETTDSLGRVWIPKPAYGSRISLGCNDGGYFGHRYGLPTDLPEAFRFRLHRDTIIEVEVVHADSSPARDFRVTLIRDMDAKPRERASARTDSSGLAQLRYFRIDQEDDRGVPFAISVSLPSTTPPRLDLDSKSPLPAKARLTLPPLGHLQVSTVQADGTPFPDGTMVQIQAGPKGSESHLTQRARGRQWMVRKISHGFDQRPIQEGKVVFPVALDQKLEVGLVYPMHGDLLTGSCDGPVTPGQTVDIDLKEETARSFLQGRFFLADGSPAVGLPVELVEVDSTGSSTSRATTDRDGVIRLPVGEATPASQWSQDEAEPVRQLHYAISTEPGVAHYGAFRFPYSLPPGVTDLGEAVLDAPILLGGHTVDRDGNAVPATRVTLRADLGESPPFKHGWTWGFCSIRTNPEGAFRFHGDLIGDFQTIEAEKDGYQKQQVKLDAGLGNHQVVLTTGENQFLRVLLPEGFPSSRLRLRLAQTTGARSSSTTTRGLRLSEGKMDLDFDPGTFELSLIMADSEQVMFRAKDVKIGAGAPQDPRLDPVDLRDVIVNQELTVLGLDGQVLPRYSLMSSGQYREHTLKAGYSFYVSRANQSYTVWAEGHRSQSIQLNGTPLEVQLEGEIPLRIRVRGTDSIPEFELIQLRLHGDTSSHRRTWDIPEDKTIETDLTHPGIYYCTARTISLPDTESGQTNHRGLLVNGEHLLFIEVDPALIPQEIEIELSLEEDDS